jgi:hypothetical protein
MDEFIKSKSMLSSGILGTTTTMITGTMVSQFGLPGNVTAIVVSFLLGLLVFTDNSIPYIQRFVFYIIISMIIFTTAMGINAAGVAATKSTEQPQYELRGLSEDEGKNFFHDWF